MGLVIRYCGVGVVTDTAIVTEGTLVPVFAMTLWMGAGPSLA